MKKNGRFYGCVKHIRGWALEINDISWDKDRASCVSAMLLSVAFLLLPYAVPKDLKMHCINIVGSLIAFPVSFWLQWQKKRHAKYFPILSMLLAGISSLLSGCSVLPAMLLAFFDSWFGYMTAWSFYSMKERIWKQAYKEKKKRALSLRRFMRIIFWGRSGADALEEAERRKK